MVIAPVVSPSVPQHIALDAISALLPTMTLAEAVTALTDWIDTPRFRAAHILPLLAQPISAKNVYVARSYGQQQDSAVMQICVWSPHAQTQIHDHASWGALRCAIGSLVEERYERLDDGLQPNRARLQKLWSRRWQPQDGPSTFLPYEGGIHRVSNPSERIAISIHLYGPRLSLFDGRDYDPAYDYVCTRYEA